jgi:hypothetical protein
MTRQRRVRALSLVGALGIVVLFGAVLLGGVGEVDGVAAYNRDASMEAMIVIGALVSALLVVAARIGKDAFRALTGKDTTPEAFALRRARLARYVIGGVGSVMTWAGVQGIFELMGGGFGGFGWALLALGPVGLALVVGAARMRMPETEDRPTPLPVVDDPDAELADRARAKAARAQVRDRHRPPVHIKTHGG